ncbi:hypothetical protein D3C84_275450 [compost metagenome]
MRHRAMAADTAQTHFEQILGGQQRAGAKAQLAGGQPGHVVHGEQRIAGEALEQTVGEHRLGAALAFLGGLED